MIRKNQNIINTQELKQIVRACIKAHKPLFIVGSPGIGKTQIVKMIALEDGYNCIDLNISLCNPTMFSGLACYDRDTKRASFLPYDHLLKMIEATKETIVFLDDFSVATQANQASAMHLLAERRIGQFPISEKVTFILASNNKGENAAVNGILEPVKSRCVSIINLEPNADDWINWAINNGIRSEVIGFIRLRPEMLWDFTPTNDFTNSPSPRTVVHVSDILNMNLPVTLQHSMIAGAIGNGFCNEFSGFLRLYQNMIDPDYIIQNPSTVEIPNDVSLIYAYMAALTYKAKKENFTKILTFAKRLPIEYNIKFVYYDLISKDKTLAETPAYIQWVNEYQNYLK